MPKRGRRGGEEAPDETCCGGCCKVVAKWLFVVVVGPRETRGKRLGLTLAKGQAGETSRRAGPEAGAERAESPTARTSSPRPPLPSGKSWGRCSADRFRYALRRTF